MPDPGDPDDDLDACGARGVLVHGGQAIDQLTGERLAPEEPLRVLGLETGQPPVRLRAPRSAARCAPDPLPGRQPQRDQRRIVDPAGRQDPYQQFARGGGGQSSPGEPVTDRAVVAEGVGSGRDLADREPGPQPQQRQLAGEILPRPDPFRIRRLRFRRTWHGHGGVLSRSRPDAPDGMSHGNAPSM
ncbi:hypothetical protein GCM10022252_74120 [Streptosporangium oxazolinicum]|uniref:Uncharacterized protein n=1 Tax=Streptosporangium oxazolinicum TaxID=909287 RepID=A0ABP8BL38_9ACTN